MLSAAIECGQAGKWSSVCVVRCVTCILYGTQYFLSHLTLSSSVHRCQITPPPPTNSSHSPIILTQPSSPLNIYRLNTSDHYYSPLVHNYVHVTITLFILRDNYMSHLLYNLYYNHIIA